MTTTQKIIKYFAIALATILIITIVSAILSGSYFLLSAFVITNTNKADNNGVAILTKEDEIVTYSMRYNVRIKDYMRTYRVQSST